MQQLTGPYHKSCIQPSLASQALGWGCCDIKLHINNHFYMQVPWSVQDRAHRSIPPEVYLAKSGIPGAGMGIFSHTFIPRYTWLGWYEGEVLIDPGSKAYDFTVSIKHTGSLY